MGARHRSRDRDRDRDRERDRDRGRDRDRDRDYDRHRRGRHSSRRSRSRSRSKSRSRNYHRRREDSVSKNGSSSAINENPFDTQSADMDSERLLMETLKTIEAVKASNMLKAAKAAEEAEKNMTPEEREREERRKKRKSRWNGSEHDKTFIPGMPTILPCTLNKDQEQAYLLQLQIEDISRKLRSGDLGIPVNIEERSPSPEPIYSSDGKRLNTREFRVRKRLEEQRHSFIMKMQSINPEFKPPIDYKPPIIKVNDKVMIPQEEHPDINFVGLLIGPRGNTLKNMEKETGAKIIIRGKGSIKEGKVGRKDGQPLPGEDEPLHAYITGTNPESVKKAVEKVKDVIKQGIEVPENQNDLRRMQLRELAQLNGTLREGDGMRCSNCAATDHKTWQCPDKPNVTNTIMCSNCGAAGHIVKDCRSKNVSGKEKTKIDEEYMHLMAELGEAAPISDHHKGGGGGAGGNHHHHYNNQNIFDNHRGPMKALNAPPPQPLMANFSPHNNAGGGWPPATPPTTNLPPPPHPSMLMQQNSAPWPPPSQGYGSNMVSNANLGWMSHQPPPPGGLMNGQYPQNAKKIPTTAPWPPSGPVQPVPPICFEPPHILHNTAVMPPPPPGLDMNALLAPPPPPPPPL